MARAACPVRKDGVPSCPVLDDAPCPARPAPACRGRRRSGGRARLPARSGFGRRHHRPATRSEGDAAALRCRVEAAADRLREPHPPPRNPAESGETKTATRQTPAAKAETTARRHRSRRIPGRHLRRSRQRPAASSSPPLARARCCRGAGRGRRQVQPGDRRHPAGQGRLLQPEPGHLPGARALRSATRPAPAQRGLSLDESEVNFQANVDPYLFGNLTLSIEPDNTAVDRGGLYPDDQPAVPG